MSEKGLGSGGDQTVSNIGVHCTDLLAFNALEMPDGRDVLEPSLDRHSWLYTAGNTPAYAHEVLR
jgi:hypothetical protein